MKPLVRWALAGVWLASTVPGWAGEVKLSFSNGLVSVVATDASPREILAEWARLGQVRVTNLDRLAGVPVTLQLTDVPEGKALETILRGTAGYIAAPRGEANWTVSRYDRILLMPGLAPPMPAAAPSPQPSAAIGRGRPGQLPFGASGASGTGSPGDTPYWSEPASGANITRPGPNRPMTPQSGPQSFVVVPGPQSFVVAQPVESGDAQQAAPLPTSSQVPGMPVGRAGQWNGATRPGQATALPTSPPKPPGQPLTPAPVGPIKVPE